MSDFLEMNFPLNLNELEPILEFLLCFEDVRQNVTLCHMICDPEQGQLTPSRPMIVTLMTPSLTWLVKSKVVPPTLHMKSNFTCCILSKDLDHPISIRVERTTDSNTEWARDNDGLTRRTKKKNREERTDRKLKEKKRSVHVRRITYFQSYKHRDFIIFRDKVSDKEFSYGEFQNF